MFCIINIMAGTLSFECSANKKKAIYKANEKIIFSAVLKEDGVVPQDKTITYDLYHDTKLIKRGKINAKEVLTLETSADTPCWIRVDLRVYDKQNKIVKQKNKRGKTVAFTGGIGAMVEPEKILPHLPEPDDFDEFWQKVRKELDAVPMTAKRTPVALSKNTAKKVVCYDVQISCAGDKSVSGYICIPKDAKPKSCPAYVSFHGAGVSSSGKNIGIAQKGLIALDINAHGIENGKPQSFYDNLRKTYYYTTLDEFRKTRYSLWNKHDRDKYYFKGIYMRLMRALDYVKSLPEWDGKHLIVSGTSQGGAQVIAACGLDKDITFARAGVPSMCDHGACLIGRHSGGPKLYTPEEHKANPAYAKCGSYYESASFAKRIKCPIYINTGFTDIVCPPPSVFAAYNSIPAGVDKHMQTTPDAGHGAAHTDGKNAINAYIRSVTEKK